MVEFSKKYAGEDYYCVHPKEYEKGGNEDVRVWNFNITSAEYNRFQKERTFPITIEYDNYKIYCDEDGFLHNLRGKAWHHDERIGEGTYNIHGKTLTEAEWIKQRMMKTIFSAQKIKTLKKLLEIPENYEKVYYDHKDKFMSLLKKI